MARLNLVVKYTLFVVIILGAGLAVERLTKITYWKTSERLTSQDLIYNASSPLAYDSFDTVLKKHYLKCLTNPSKPFCLLAANKRLELLESHQARSAEVVESRLKNINSDLHSRRLRMHSIVAVFSRFMKNHNIKVLLIEPSMLFCLLSSEKKYNMLMKGFNPTRLQGSRNVVTLGVLSKDSKKLEGVNFTKEALSAGFKIVKFRKSIRNESEKSFETVHYFFILQDMAVHVVVFYPQNNYLWHAGMDTQKAVLEDLLFVEEGIFENFTLLPLNLEGTSISRLFLPHDIRYFMQQMAASRTVECRATSPSGFPALKHPNLTTEQLNTRAVIALQELKAIMAPQLIIFWLWSDTLLGWFAKCDIFHYSTALELAVTYRSTEGLDLPVLLADNDFLTFANYTESRSGFKYQLMCHGLDINLFVLQEDKNSVRLDPNDEQNIFNTTYPVFAICSTTLFGHKMHVPCNAEEILKVETGEH